MRHQQMDSLLRGYPERRAHHAAVRRRSPLRARKRSADDRPLRPWVEWQGSEAPARLALLVRPRPHGHPHPTHRLCVFRNAFGPDIDQGMMIAAMDAITAPNRTILGKRGQSLCADAGFCSVGVDEGWEACGVKAVASGNTQHDAQGRPTINTTRFPSMKQMVDYGHGKGLEVGWYQNVRRPRPPLRSHTPPHPGSAAGASG